MIGEFVIVFFFVALALYFWSELTPMAALPPAPNPGRHYCEECLYNEWTYVEMEWQDGDPGDRHHPRIREGWFCPECGEWDE